MESITRTTFPIVLTSFEATQVRTHAELQWETVEEINSSHFIVEKSWDGHYFEAIGRVKAAGNSHNRRVYQLRDEDLKAQPTPRAYYRLQQVDLDGTTVPGKTIALTLDAQHWHNCMYTLTLPGKDCM